jgi:hypothetical protein
MPQNRAIWAARMNGYSQHGQFHAERDTDMWESQEEKHGHVVIVLVWATKHDSCRISPHSPQKNEKHPHLLALEKSLPVLVQLKLCDLNVGRVDGDMDLMAKSTSVRSR